MCKYFQHVFRAKRKAERNLPDNVMPCECVGSCKRLLKEHQRLVSKLSKGERKTKQALELKLLSTETLFAKARARQTVRVPLHHYTEGLALQCFLVILETCYPS